MKFLSWVFPKKPLIENKEIKIVNTEIVMSENRKITKIYEGDCPEDLQTIEFSCPTSNAHLKGFYVGANGGVKVNINDFYEPILELDEEINPADVAEQEVKIRTLEKEARGNWLNVSFQKGTINPSATIAIFAEFE